MKRYFQRVFGNQELIDFFSSAYQNGTLAHAYIIEGDQGSGKTTIARSVCAMLSQADHTLDDKIFSGCCPDVSEYGLPDKKKFIPIETVRNVKAQAYIKPSELDIRAFIIKDAHLLTSAGQNALLKLLEEPPFGVYFFLLCSNSSSLLPTVRSRAPTVRVQRFSADQLEDYLSDVKGIERGKLSHICKKAGGSIGVLLELMENTSEGKEKQLSQSILEQISQGNFPTLLSTVHSLPSDRRLLSIALAHLGGEIRDAIASSCGSDIFIENQAPVKCGIPVKNLIRIYQCVENAIDALNLNMNTQIVKTALAKHIMRAAKQ